MASQQIDFLGEYWPWIVVFITVVTTAYAGLKSIFCKGKKEANGENRLKLIEDEILLLDKKLMDLQQDFEEKENKANDTHTEIKEGIAKINGILETMQKSLEKN